VIKEQSFKQPRAAFSATSSPPSGLHDHYQRITERLHRAIRISKWLQNLGVAAAETLLLSDLFLPIDVADSLWSLEVEDKIIADLKKFVG